MFCYARLFGEIGVRECNSDLLEKKCGITQAMSIKCTLQFSTLESCANLMDAGKDPNGKICLNSITQGYC